MTQISTNVRRVIFDGFDRLQETWVYRIRLEHFQGYFITSSRILNDFPMSVEEVVKVKVALYDEKELLGDIEYLVSLNIKNRLNLKETYSISTDDESDQLGQLIHQELGGICADCLKEYKEKHGWHL